MGTGDLVVPKRIRKMAENVYGRADVYRAALAAEDMVALASAVERNVRPAAPGAAEGLARYMSENCRALRSHDFDALAQGRIDWVTPATMASA